MLEKNYLKEINVLKKFILKDYKISWAVRLISRNDKQWEEITITIFFNEKKKINWQCECLI